MIVIGVDAMGGEKAPLAPLEASLVASDQLKLTIKLFGPKTRLLAQIPPQRPEPLLICIEDSQEVITMEDIPVISIREKQESSLVKLIRALREGEVNAVVGAGNTGAMVAASVMILGKLRSIRRPGLLGILPGRGGPVGIIDVGANVDSRPKDLLGFAVMASLFWKGLTKVPNPKIGLLNIGAERDKGNRVVKEAFRSMEQSMLNFVGNVEGNEVLQNKADVVICDGFVGNILLKALEGLGEIIYDEMPRYPEGLPLKGSLSWEEYGGAVLLGVNGVVIVCHGRSTSKSIYKAIGFAKEILDRDLLNLLKLGLEELN